VVHEHGPAAAADGFVPENERLWPDAARLLRTYDPERDEKPSCVNPIQARALLSHLQSQTQQSAHKCCLAGEMSNSTKERVLPAIEARVAAASRRTRAAMLGLLSLVRFVVADIWQRQQGTPAERLLAASDGIRVSGLHPWNTWLIRQLMVGIGSAQHPVAAVTQLYSLPEANEAFVVCCAVKSGCVSCAPYTSRIHAQCCRCEHAFFAAQ
jgi:hypothetical protein